MKMANIWECTIHKIMQIYEIMSNEQVSDEILGLGFGCVSWRQRRTVCRQSREEWQKCWRPQNLKELGLGNVEAEHKTLWGWLQRERPHGGWDGPASVRETWGRQLEEVLKGAG